MNSYYAGLDVGKLSFDVSLVNSEQLEIGFSQFTNNEDGLVKLLKWIKKFKIAISDVLFCAEDMGSYISDIALFSTQKKLQLALLCPLSLKRSLGIQRGKNDRIDAKRIAVYACLHHRSLKLFAPQKKIILELKSWLTIRENLVKQKVAQLHILEKLHHTNKLAEVSEQSNFIKGNIDTLIEQINDIEKRIRKLIASDVSISRNYKLLCSIKGVAIITATVMICSTNNFENFSDHRKFACYCGVAPFEHSSGISVRGKTQVSSMANRKIKVALSRAAMSAINFDPQIKAYYQRKLKEGKHKSSIANAVKAKIIARCFAVVKRGLPYVVLQPSLQLA
jgi:transposase